MSSGQEKHRKDTMTSGQNNGEEKTQAAEYNKYGWCQIHEACYKVINNPKGFIFAVKRIVENSFDKSQQLELLTKDDLCVTPIVIAVLGGHYELVQYLVESKSNVNVRNTKGHGIIEIAAIRQDFKMLMYFVKLNNPDLSPFMWANLIKLIASTEDEGREMCLAASRCLENVTDIRFYNSEEYTSELWVKNCQDLLSSVIFKTLSKIISEYPTDQVTSCFVLIMNLLNYSAYTKRTDTVLLFLKQDGYPCLINYLDILSTKDDELVCLFGQVLKALAGTEEDAKAFIHRQFDENPDSFFLSLINALRDIKEPDNIYSYIYFLIDMMNFNKDIDVPFDVWKNLVIFIISCSRKFPSHEKLMTSLLNLIVSLINFLPIIIHKLIDEGLASFINEALKPDNENLRVSTMETIKVLCLNRIEIQIALFTERTDDQLFILLNKYHTKFLKKTTINALWAIAGDDILQRQMVVNKMSLGLINDCLSDNDNLNVIGCNALCVMLEQPPNCTQAAHETFLKFESVPRLCRILTTTNQDPVNMLAALRCMKKLCAMCGDNCHRKAQVVVKNSEAMPLLISFIHNGKQEDIIKAEAICALAYLCLENKEHIKLAINKHGFSYQEVFGLLKKVHDKNVKLLLTKSLAIFAYNNPEQEKLIKSVGILDYEIFEKFFSSGDDMDLCEAAYQTILLSQLIFNMEPSRLIMRGIHILIGFFEAKSTQIKLRCFVVEKLVSLSRLKNGIAEALLDIDFVEILASSLHVENEAFRGYVSIALSNLSVIPDGKRKLLKICRQDLSVIELLEFYNNYNESNHRLSDSFMKEWNHVKVYFENNKEYTASR